MVCTRTGSIKRALTICGALLLLAQAAAGEVVRIDVRRRDDLGTHERVVGRVHFAIDPNLPANRAVADIALAPRNAAGMVEFSGDLLFFRPKDASHARGTVFIEVVNRGRDQSLGILSGGVSADPTPESWDLGDRFLLEQGFAVAFIGWQFDVRPAAGLSFEAPVAPVEGIVRQSFIESVRGSHQRVFALPYCAADPDHGAATLTFRSAMNQAPKVTPRDGWQLAPDGCTARVRTNGIGIYEIVYQAKGSPVAGLGLAAIRDFASYLKNGAAGAPLRETPEALQRAVGYGYSQSARLLREFVRDGFNADERGRQVFDGLMISSAGAGGGSFNHRFAMPGIAGNSVLSVLRPVDVPPFTDDDVLAKAQAAGVTPKIFYTFSSTEYWARAGSLTHTSDDGQRDVPVAPTSRLYFLAGTPHALGMLGAGRPTGMEHVANFAEPRWVTRALLLDLDGWVREGVDPPASQHPLIARRQLVPRSRVRFPSVAGLPFPSYMPQVWRMDFGADFNSTRVITLDPPSLGAPYHVLVPQVDADGNDLGGIRLPEVAVPLGTFTGWNVTTPELKSLRYLAGLVGSFATLPLTKQQREESGDERLSIQERYAGRQDYLNRVKQAADDLVRQRFLRKEDLPAVMARAHAMWTVVVSGGSRTPAPVLMAPRP